MAPSERNIHLDKPNEKRDSEEHAEGSRTTQNGQPQNGSYKNGETSKKDSESQRAPPRSRFAAALQTFSPIWFALVMNAGVLGIIMHQTPQPYNGLWWQICSYILYIASLVLFFGFMLIFLLRAILYPKSVPGLKESQPSVSVETTAISACMPIAASTLIGQTVLIASAANWNGTGYGFMIFCYVAWWADVVWILATSVTTLVLMTTKKDMSPDGLPPACIIPGVGMVTIALTGAIVVTYGHDVSVQLAMPVIIVGYIMLGWGIFWSLFIYPILLHKFLDEGWPEPEKIPSLAFLAGPPGQAAGALVSLGSAAMTYFPQYDQGSSIYTVAGGQSFSATSVLFAFLFLGLYALWLLYALYGIFETLLQGKLKKFTFLFWGTIFPTATGNLAFVQLSVALNSQAFAVLGCIWLVALFIVFFACLIFTVIGIFKGELLDGREREEKEARQKAD